MTFTKISVLIPTRGRVDCLQKLLESYARTTIGCAELVFRVDEDDTASQRFLERQQVVVGPRYEGYASMATFFNELWKASTGDVLMLGNDDMVFRTPRWDALILKEANVHPDGIFNLGVQTFNDGHFPFSIISRHAAEVMGELWDPRVFWGDIYLRDVMAAFGRARLIPHVHVEHEWMGFRPDATFTEVSRAVPPDYWDVHGKAIADAVEKLKEVTCSPSR